MSVEVEIFARNMVVTESLRDYVTKKASKLDRYLNEIEHVKVDLDYIKSARSATDRFIAQITVRGHKALLRTEESADEIFAAFDKSIDKMQRQMERFKGKHHHGRGEPRMATVAPAATDQEAVEENSTISRRKTFELIPMTEMDALEQMRMLGHDNFFIFFNAATASINVLYHRRDGTYGLIEPKVG
jgi:putative sigma-54 modulation protein